MTKTERTNILLNEYRGTHDEFSMLKGVLCMSQGYCHGNITPAEHERQRKAQRRIEAIFDGAMIARRMDEINREAATFITKQLKK